MSRNAVPKPESAPKSHRNSIGKGVTETLGKLLSSLKIGASTSKASKSGMDVKKEPPPPPPVGNDEKRASFGRAKSSGSSQFSLASQKRDGNMGEADFARDIATSQETLADYASVPSETQYCSIEIRISDTGDSDEQMLGSSDSLGNDFENERAFAHYPQSIEPWQQMEPNYLPYDEFQHFEFANYSPTPYDDTHPPEDFSTELNRGTDWGGDPQIRGKLREPIRSFEEDGLIPIATQPGSIPLSATTRSRSWTNLFIEKTQTQTWKRPTRIVGREFNSADSLKRPKKMGSPKCADPKTKNSNRFQSRFSNERQPGSRRGSGAFMKGETLTDEAVSKRAKDGTRQTYATLRSSLRKNGRMATGYRFGSASHLSKIHNQNSLSVDSNTNTSDSPNSPAGSPQIFQSREKGLLYSPSYCIDDARHQGSSGDTSMAFSRLGSDTSAVSTTILENIVPERLYSQSESGHIFRSPSSYWSSISKHICSTPDQISDDSGASPSLHSFSKWPSFSTLSPSRTRVPAFKQQTSQDSINFSPTHAATRHEHRIGRSATKRSVSDSSASRSSNAYQPVSRAPSSRCRSKERHQVVESSVVYEKQDLYSLKQLTKSLGTADEKVQGKINQYVIIRDIGSGAYGAVKLCKNQINEFYYACKVISKSKLQKKFRWKSNAMLASRPNSAEAEPESMPAIKKEIAILKKLSKHPNINVLVEVIDDDKEDNLYMFFELCERGPVMNIKVNEPDRPYSEELARHYFRDLLLGIEYRECTSPAKFKPTETNNATVHKNRIIHRDIKPANLLLSKDRILQIADFGISHMFSEGEDDQIHDKNTSPLFCPPEACRMDSDGPTAVHGFPFDVWSMGVTLFCLVHGYCPFEDDCLPDLYNKICNDMPIISETLSQELNLLITAMLDKNPNLRPTIKQIRSDPWVLNYGSEPLISEEENCITEDVTEEDIRNAVGKRFMDQMIKVFRRLTSKMTIMVGSESPSNIGDANFKTGTPMGKKKQMGKSGSDILHAPPCHPSERGMKKYSSDSRLAEPVLDFSGVAGLARDLRTEDSQSAGHLTVPKVAQ
ncbi:hypothetical protein BJ741DRAFT_322042 [Chytriomyces cf. hyalinus JEL632]|nr:hypothetical protein BJ741DRAFT_322042 [Chytriomyces cf. hyalinus JEL632]